MDRPRGGVGGHDDRDHHRPLTALLDWLAALPLPVFYVCLALAAFAENLVPPLPADSVIALGAFLVARGEGSLIGVWAATMIGNIAGAVLLMQAGRRYGLPWLLRRLPQLMAPHRVAQFQGRFATHGMLAVVISRFLPAVRAVVPPVAGALNLPPWRTGIAMTAASAVWYGVICVVAYRAGDQLDLLLARIAQQQRTLAVLAVAALAVALLVLGIRRLRRG
jgi:membrane-associated protein